MTSKSGWTDQRRERHRAAIQTWKPWARSTGPRSVEGKQRSSRNAVRNGGRTAQIEWFKKLLAHHRQWLRLVRAHFEHHIFSENELLAACNAGVETGPDGRETDIYQSNPYDLMLYWKTKVP